jgi:putative SOS response-associated peptidase YedK
MAGLVDDRGRFTVVTRAATEQMAALHDRMPAMLVDPAAEAAWLDPDRPFAEVRDLLTAWDGVLDIDADADGPAPSAQPDMFGSGRARG